jgi:hypothetical protein
MAPETAPSASFLASIADPLSVTTYIDSAILFPQVLEEKVEKYGNDIKFFSELVAQSDSSATLLGKIRSANVPKERRMSLLKIFRRAVSTVCDTERTKKFDSIKTEQLVEQFGDSFKPIEILKAEFKSLTSEQYTALAALIGEYDDRGKLGYLLVQKFFHWFKAAFPQLVMEGPEGAGKDTQLSKFYKQVKGEFPFDFLVRQPVATMPLVIGFARYDSTRGGAQSDDRTQGNMAKVAKVRELAFDIGVTVKLLFVADGPGLAHGDTWRAACELDGSWGDNVRVTTLKLAPQRVTVEWMQR